MESSCFAATLLDGLAIRGSDVNDAKPEVEQWIDASGIITVLCASLLLLCTACSQVLVLGDSSTAAIR